MAGSPERPPFQPDPEKTATTRPNRPLSFEYFSHEPRYVAMNTELVNSFMQGLQDGDIIFDIACGTGGNTKIAQKTVQEAGVQAAFVAIDMNHYDLTIAKKNVPGAYFVQADATRLPFRSNIARKAMLAHVIHEVNGTSTRIVDGVEQEVDNKDLAIEEMLRICKPGGDVMMISGFTGEMFNFPDRPRGAREEVSKHNEVRKRSFEKLGQERDKTKKSFTPLPSQEYIDKLAKAGFVNITTSVVYQPYDSASMRLIGEDPGWLRGTFQDMTNTETISPEKKRDAYLAAIDEMETEYNEKYPREPLLYPRNFVVFKAGKPE